MGTAEKQGITKTGQIVVFDNVGEGVAITASSTTTPIESALDVLLIGGIPLNEPVARYGPFVMKEEILQAIEDYRNGKMGKLTSRMCSILRFEPIFVYEHRYF